MCARLEHIFFCAAVTLGLFCPIFAVGKNKFCRLIEKKFPFCCDRQNQAVLTNQLSICARIHRKRHICVHHCVSEKAGIRGHPSSLMWLRASSSSSPAPSGYIQRYIGVRYCGGESGDPTRKLTNNGKKEKPRIITFKY